MTELEKLLAGLPYDFTDKEVNQRKITAVKKCEALNQVSVLDREKRCTLMKELLGSCGEGVSILPTFQCDYGKNIHIGNDFVMNFNGVILDIAPVYIGNHVMIGPNTMICTVNHPLDFQGRRDHLGIAKEVRIGDDVWIGGNCTILPGVTIGNRVVVAAGAVVTKDIPDDSLVAGVPAKVIRKLNE